MIHEGYDHPRPDVPAGKEFPKPPDRRSHRRMRRFRHLEFHGDERLEGLFDQQVDFELILGLQEIPVWPPSLMEKYSDVEAEVDGQTASP